MEKLKTTTNKICSDLSKKLNSIFTLLANPCICHKHNSFGQMARKNVKKIVNIKQNNRKLLHKPKKLQICPKNIKYLICIRYKLIVIYLRYSC